MDYITDPVLANYLLLVETELKRFTLKWKHAMLPNSQHHPTLQHG